MFISWELGIRNWIIDINLLIFNIYLLPAGRDDADNADSRGFIYNILFFKSVKIHVIRGHFFLFAASCCAMLLLPETLLFSPGESPREISKIFTN